MEPRNARRPAATRASRHLRTVTTTDDGSLRHERCKPLAGALRSGDLAVIAYITAIHPADVCPAHRTGAA